MRARERGDVTSAVEVLNISSHGIWIFVKGREFFYRMRASRSLKTLVLQRFNTSNSSMSTISIGLSWTWTLILTRLSTLIATH